MAQRQLALQEAKFSSKNQHLEGASLLEQATEIQKKSSTTFSDAERQQPVQRIRILPAWMRQTEITVQNPPMGNAERVNKTYGKKKMKTENETALETQHVRETSTEHGAERMEKVKSQRVPQGTESSAEQCNHHQLENEESALNRDIQACLFTELETTNATGNQLEGISSNTEWVSQDRAPQSLVHQDEFEELALKQSTERDISNLAGSQNLPQSSDVPIHQRTVCQYGRSCYRKNPLHFQQFSHPGDGDYYVTEAVTQADTDNRPECPYGTACYRKNPQHKLEYKHTVPPEAERRQLRPKTVKKGTFSEQNDDDDDGDDDDDSLDECSPPNSLVAHEEDEECDSTDEDSDWKPDIQDQDQEDVDTLLKEGHNFVKSKK